MKLASTPRRTLLSLFALALTSGVAGGVLEACSDESGSGTTGRRVALATVVVGEPAAKAPFTNALGWTITLRTAQIGVGPLYYFDGEPIFARAAFPPPAWGLALGPRRAWAHPGHYVAGNARGEMTGASSADLLAAANDLPPGQGVSGPYRSARLAFQSGAGPFAASLGSAVVVVAGEAKKDATVVRFRAAVREGELLDGDEQPKVEGCVFTPADVASDGTVTLTVKPTVWFDQVDFAGVPAFPGDEGVDLEGIAREGLARGIRKGSAYVFSFAPKS